MFRFFLSFFSFLVIISSFVILGAFTTAPKAEAACTNDPTWQVIGHSDGPRYVTYHMKLINNCAGSNTFRIRVSGLPTAPRTLNADWLVKKENGTWGDLNTTINRTVSGSERIDFRVIRDVDHYHPDGTYRFVSIRAALNSNTSINNTYNSLVYIVVNRPDLIVSAFNYPGGPTCQSTNPNVRIKNIGWVPITTDFVVKVDNGFAATRTHTVTQRVDHGEVINLSGRFSGMGLPPVGSYRATAKVDSSDRVFEEVEGNNKAGDNYNTTSCVTPPPPTVPPVTEPPPVTDPPVTIPPPTVPPVTEPPTPTPDDGTYTISGGVFIDDLVEALGGNIGRKDAGEVFADGTNAPQYFSAPAAGILRINGVDYTTGASGLTSAALPAGTYSISYINFPSDPTTEYTLTYPTNLSVPPSVNVTLGSGCFSVGGDSTCSSGSIANLHFGIKPPDVAPKWINGVGGDLRIDNQDFESIIPNNFYFSEKLSSDPSVNDHGIIFGGNNLNIGSPKSVKANINEWIVDEDFAFEVFTEYGTMYNILDRGGALNNSRTIFGAACTGNSAPFCSLDPNLLNGVYTQSAPNVVLNGPAYEFQTGYSYIFLINGNLRIETDISVPVGSTVMFIVSGEITVAANVTTLEGIYSTDSDFTIEGGTGSDQQLTISGSMIVNADQDDGEFVSDRDLGVQNETTPSVNFIFRPDFVLNMPELLRYPSYIIREVAPGSKPF